MVNVEAFASVSGVWSILSSLHFWRQLLWRCGNDSERRAYCTAKDKNNWAIYGFWGAGESAFVVAMQSLWFAFVPKYIILKTMNTIIAGFFSLSRYFAPFVLLPLLRTHSTHYFYYDEIFNIILAKFAAHWNESDTQTQHTHKVSVTVSRTSIRHYGEWKCTSDLLLDVLGEAFGLSFWWNAYAGARIPTAWLPYYLMHAQ